MKRRGRKPLLAASLLLLGASLFLPRDAAAAALTWTGPNGGSWSTASNWSPAVVPSASDDVLIDATLTVIVPAGTTAVFNSLTLGGGSAPTLQVTGGLSSAGSLTIHSGATFVQDSLTPLSLGRVEVLSGGGISHVGNGATRTRIVNMAVAGDFSIAAGASVFTDGRGYPARNRYSAGYGPGAGSNNSGAGHGGNGADGYGYNNNYSYGGHAYDSVTDPTDLGSGGGADIGSGTPGGGAVLLSVGGTLTVEGVITANAGESGSGGGGAGGTVNIRANAISGSGTIKANGNRPSGSGGGGGGGRVAIVAANDASSWDVQANGFQGGGAGTIAKKIGGVANYSLSIGTTTYLPVALTPIAGASLAYDAITLGAAKVDFETDGGVVSVGSVLVVGTASWTGGQAEFSGAVTVAPTAILRFAADSTSGGDLDIKGRGWFEQGNAARLNFNSVLVESGGLLSHKANYDARAYVVNIAAGGDLVVETGGLISGDGLGYASRSGFNQGFGPGAGSNGSGAGHGGNGEGAHWYNRNPADGGLANGSVTNPTELGSGGGGGNTTGAPGGGAILLDVGGTLNLNGVISATGGRTSGGGGGAGGTVNITAGALAGTGIVRADGSDGAGGGATGWSGAGGGGGGRVAIVAGSDGSAWDVRANGVSGAGVGVVARKIGGAAHYSLDIGTPNYSPVALTPIPGTSFTFDTLRLRNSRVVFDTPISEVSADAILIEGAASVAAANLNVESLIRVSPGMEFLLNAPEMSGGLLDVRGTFSQVSLPAMRFSSVTVYPGGVLTHANNGTISESALNFRVAGDFLLASGASISVDGRGFRGGSRYSNGAGPAGGQGSGVGAGGGHGGSGGSNGGTAYGGLPYGSLTFPSALGSWGGGSSSYDGGAGGGAVVLEVGGTATIDGLITARGASNGSAGGGAGGSIQVEAGT